MLNVLSNAAPRAALRPALLSGTALLGAALFGKPSQMSCKRAALLRHIIDFMDIPRAEQTQASDGRRDIKELGQPGIQHIVERVIIPELVGLWLVVPGALAGVSTGV